MITPADIEVKEFSRAKRGYDEVEVDLYLDQIIMEMESLIKENKELKKQLELAKAEASRPQSPDTSVYETLEAAKSLMNDIAQSAERRAEILLKNAELEASLITREAKENVARYTEEGNRLYTRVESLKDRYKRMLQEELDRIDNSGQDILAEFEKDFMHSSLLDTAEKEPAKAEDVSVEKVDLTKTMVMRR